MYVWYVREAARKIFAWLVVVEVVSWIVQRDGGWASVLQILRPKGLAAPEQALHHGSVTFPSESSGSALSVWITAVSKRSESNHDYPSTLWGFLSFSFQIYFVVLVILYLSLQSELKRKKIISMQFINVTLMNYSVAID